MKTFNEFKEELIEWQVSTTDPKTAAQRKQAHIRRMAGGGRARAKLAQMKFKNRGGGRIIKQNPQKAKMNLAKGLTAGGGQKKRVLVTKGQSAQGKAVQKKRELQKKLSGQK